MKSQKLPSQKSPRRIDERLAKQAEIVSGVLKQLAHPARLKVLCCLLSGEKTVTELIDYTGASQSWTSQFLARMKLEGLVTNRKDSQFVYYRIADPKLESLMSAINSVYCEPERKLK